LIKILGLGPSGSALALLLGKEVKAVDIYPKYYKACGEALPVETPLVGKKYVLNKIRRFAFYLEDRSIGEVSYATPRWYIVDKSSWISSLREEIKSAEEEEEEIRVDARGPYSSKGVKINIVRAYVKGARRSIDPETVYFIYEKGVTGFYWVFPHGEDLNIGGGFLEIRNPVPNIHRFLDRWLGGGSIEDLKGAPLTIYPEIDLGSQGLYRIGEAAGLVYPLTGEGIRPGIESAYALASALSSKKPVESYARALSRIVRQIEIQKRVLRAVVRIVKSGGSVSQLIDNSVLRDYIEENISGRTLLAMISRNPLKGVSLITTILKS
jgi:flavin-dependent dehydrogenase